MDEMTIQSDWTKLILKKIICKIIKDKTGIKPKLEFGDIHIMVRDATVDISLSVEAQVSKSELGGLLQKYL